MSRRTEKIGDQLQSEIAELLHRHVKHPVLAQAMLSITRVEVRSDFSRARVYISVMTAESDESEAVMAALERTEPYLHRALVKRLRMRRVPRLTFVADPSIAEGERLSAVLRAVARSEGRGS